MRTVYTCPICKHPSEFEQNIRDCEAQGRKNRFQLKQPVTFFNDNKETSGIIVDIYFVPKTHRVLYSIEKAPGERVTVADENIVHAEALPTV